MPTHYNEEKTPSLLDASNPGELAKAALSTAGVEFDEDPVEKEFQISNLASLVHQRVEESRHGRFETEAQWYRNYKAFSMMDNEKLRSESEISDVYMRTTTVKTRAAFAQIIEALLSDSRFPLEVSATEVPEGVAEFAHLGNQAPQEPEAEGEGPDSQADFGLVNGLDFGFEGDGRELAPGATLDALHFLGGMENELGEAGLVEGPARQGEPQISPAKEAARKLDRKIQDQLSSSQARTELRRMVFEMCMLGAGALKGPFNTIKKHHRWVMEDGERVYKPIETKSPQLSFVSMWNLYWDLNASRVEDAEWVAEKHKMSRYGLSQLKKRPNFDADKIDEVIMGGPNYVENSFESQIRDEVNDNPGEHLWQVWEYWGYMPTDKVREHGVEVPDDAEDVVQVNMWYSGDTVIRLVLNPFLPARIPYYITPYEEKPYNMVGVGVPEAMEDSQKMINGFARMAVENMALAGNLVFDVDEGSLVQGQDMTIYPGKVFKRMAGTQGNAINGIKFPNTANENLMLMQEFRRHADEATGIPSIAHGQTGVSGYGRTSSGMSMLLNNASLNIKTVVRNIDDYLLKPLGEAYFNWNMQYASEDMPEIVGDLEIRAKGSSSLQLKEVRAQRLQTFLQISANPALAPLIKLPTILKELAISMDMQPEEILNSPDEAKIYAQLMGMQGMQQPGGGAQSPTGEQGGVPMPTDPEFTGNDVSQGNPLGVNSSQEGV